MGSCPRTLGTLVLTWFIIVMIGGLINNAQLTVVVYSERKSALQSSC